MKFDEASLNSRMIIQHSEVLHTNGGYMQIIVYTGLYKFVSQSQRIENAVFNAKRQIIQLLDIRGKVAFEMAKVCCI